MFSGVSVSYYSMSVTYWVEHEHSVHIQLISMNIKVIFAVVV